MKVFLVTTVVFGFLLNAVLGQTGCLVKPSENLQDVAPACERDVGMCSREPCILCHDQTSKCCGPVFHRVTTTCPSRVLEFSKVDRCSCLPCDPFQVFISGSITGDCANQDACNLLIKYKGGTTRAAGDGTFSFAVDFPDDGRVLITVEDDMQDKYFTQQKIVNAVNEVQAYNDIAVYVTDKPTPVIWDATTREVVTLGMGPELDLVFPPNSVTRPDGSAYTGMVSASINFIDPAATESEFRIPLELITAGDPEGVLTSSGMMQIELTDGSGNPLIATGVEVYLDTTNLNAGESEGMGIYGMNTNTGFWELLSAMTLTSTDPNAKRRKKRQVAPFITGTIDISNAIQIWNLDALMWPYCYMKVRLFVGAADPATMVEVSNIPVTSVYRRSTNATNQPTNAWTNFITRYSGSNGMCVYVPCDQENHDVNLVAVYAGGFITMTPNMSQALQTQFTYNDHGFQFTVIIPASGATDDPNGPIYTSFTPCYNAPFSDNHFVLAKNAPDDKESNVVEIDEDNICSSFVYDVYSWWPNKGIYKACYIKVLFVELGGEGNDILPGNLLPMEVKVVSRGGTHSVTAGNDYGYRISETNGTFACIEYKCPDTLFGGEFDRTEIEVIPMNNETIKLIIVNLYNISAEVNDANLQLGNATFTGPAPQSNPTGVYMDTATHPTTAKKNAREKCLAGNEMGLIFHEFFNGNGNGNGTQQQ